MKARSMLVKEDFEGFEAFAFLFWYRAISKNMKIVPNVKPFIKDFFKEL
jgi:hypothetical protein